MAARIRLQARQIAAAIVRMLGQDALHGGPNRIRAQDAGIPLPNVFPLIPTATEIRELVNTTIVEPPEYRSCTPGVTPFLTECAVRRHNGKKNAARSAKNQLLFSFFRNKHFQFLLLGRDQDGTRPPGFACPNSLHKILRTCLAEWYVIADWFGFDWRRDCLSVGQCRSEWASFHGVAHILHLDEIIAFTHISWSTHNHPNHAYILPAVVLPPPNHPNFARNHEGNVREVNMPLFVPGWQPL